MHANNYKELWRAYKFIREHGGDQTAADMFLHWHISMLVSLIALIVSVVALIAK